MRTIFLLCVLLFTGVNKAWAINGERLSFCYESWRPYIYTDSLDEVVGLQTEFIRQTLAPYNYQLVFIELPYLRCLKKVQRGEIDFVLNVDRTDESSDLLLIDHPIGHWDLLLAYQAKSQNEGIAEEKQKLQRVVIAREYNYPQVVLDFLHENSEQILKRSYFISSKQEVKNLFTLLENGFVDAILVDKSWAMHEMLRQPLGITLSEKILSSQPQYIGYIEQNSAVAERILQALTTRANQ